MKLPLARGSGPSPRPAPSRKMPRLVCYERVQEEEGAIRIAPVRAPVLEIHDPIGE